MQNDRQTDRWRWPGRWPRLPTQVWKTLKNGKGLACHAPGTQWTQSLRAASFLEPNKAEAGCPGPLEGQASFTPRGFWGP